jgi:hypothetical protein
MPCRSVLLLLVVICSACAPRRDRVNLPVTAEEQTLLSQITRDNFMIITQAWRDDLGRLTVETQQGNGTAIYVLAPDIDGARGLSIRPRRDTHDLDSALPEPPPQLGVNRGR